MPKQALRLLDQLLLPLGVDVHEQRTQVLIFAVRSVALQLGRHLAAERVANQWQLHIAHTSERALEQLRAAAFDLLVVDLSDQRIRTSLDRILSSRGRAPVLALVDDEHTPYAASVREAGVEEVLETRHLIGPSMARLLRLMLERARADAQTRLLATAVDDSPIGHAIADATAPDTPIIYVNDAFLALTGYERSEVIGRNSRFLQGQDTDARDVDRIRTALRRGEALQIELLNYGKDGQAFWNAMTLKPIRAADDSVTHYAATIRNVTQQRTMTASLQRNALVHRMLIEASGGMVVFSDAQGLPRSPSAEFERFTGLGYERYRTGNWSDVIHPEDRSRVDMLIRGARTARRPVSFDARLWHAISREWRHVEWRFLPVVDKNNEVAEWIGTLTDIHDRRSAELALQRHEEFLTTVLDSLPLLVLYVDSSSHVTFANRTAADWLARDSRTLDGISLAEAFADREVDADPNRNQEYVASALSGKRVWFVQRLAADGTERLLETAYVPHHGPHGPLGFFVLAIDTRERELLMQELQQAQKLDALGRLTGGIAHDFNNLLNVIIGNLQLIGRTSDVASSVARQSATALRAAMRGADLTRRLLTFSRQQAPNLTPLAVAEHVLSMAEMLRRMLPDNIEIRFDVDRNAGHSLLDAAQLESALLNLTINARDAMPNGGAIDIGVRPFVVDDSATQDAGSLHAGEYVVIEVRDSGIGMSDEVRARALKPFFTTKNEDKGAGLGLSMVDVFVRQCGGQLRIESELGTGTSVRLYFSQSAAEITATVPQIELVVGGSETILLVEDEAEVRATTTQILLSLGYTVIEAPTAIQAMQLFEAREDIDLLFSDVMLPGGVLGTTLIDRARALRPDVAVLLTTGFAESGALDIATPQSDLPVLWKPFQYAELATALRKALDARQTSSLPIAD